MKHRPSIRSSDRTQSGRTARALRRAVALSGLAAGLALTQAEAATVAYYRFEDGSAGGTINPATDSVGGNSLTATLTPTYVADVPVATVPLTAQANTLAANYTAANEFHVAGLTGTLATTAFSNFTIECYVKMNGLSGWQTLVGRDDSGAPGQGTGATSLFYLSKAGAAVGTGLNNGFRVELITASNTSIAVNSRFVPVIGTWYHVAVVGNSSTGTLTLFVNGVSVGSTTGFTGLFVPTSGSDCPWTLGRGEYNNGAGDYLNGWLDEVRFSDTALTPSQFLNVDPNSVVAFTTQPVAYTGSVGSSFTLSVATTGGPTYQWQKSIDGGTTWTNISGATDAVLSFTSATYAANGLYRVVATNSLGSLTSDAVAVALTYPAPTITGGSSSSTLLTGTDTTLSVTATGLGTLTYQWFYNGVAISGQTGTSLALGAMSASTAGTYSVVVTDPAALADGLPATTTTKEIVLTVIDSSAATMAYYRFEDGTAGSVIGSATDSAGGSALSGLGSQAYTATVPAATVARTGAANLLSADMLSSGNNGFVAPTTGTLADADFTDFTIEAFVRHSSIGGWQTLIGRDDDAVPGQGTGSGGLFYLSKANSSNVFRVEVINKSNTALTIDSSSVASLDVWYHVAAVGNSLTGTLKLYVNGVEVGSRTGFNGLLKPTSGSNTPWTFGRAQWAGNAVDYLRGNLDEIRFSRVALPPSRFLNSDADSDYPRPTITAAPAWKTIRKTDSTSFSVTATGQGNLTYQWFKDGVTIPGATAATLELTNVLASAEGVYSVTVYDDISVAAGYPPTRSSASAKLYVVDAELPTRALSLNFVGSSTGQWSFSPELGVMLPTDSAGFLPVTTWNNSATENYISTSTTPLALAENTGAASAATASWESANTWSMLASGGLPADKTPNVRLFHGYIESRATTGATVTVNNIPYGTYDVYVYVGGGRPNQVGSVTINRSGAPTYYYLPISNDVFNSSTTALPLMLTKSTTIADARNAANASFARFSGVTGDSLTISTIDAVLDGNAGGICAVQIVDTTPAGAAYPTVVSSFSGNKLLKAGESTSLSVTATPGNSGGALTYQWSYNGTAISGATSASLPLNSVTSAINGTYTVAITETSPLATTTVTRSADVIVVDASRSLLINGDFNGSTPTFAGYGFLNSDGTTVSYTQLGTGSHVWNGITGAGGSATRTLAKDSAGLAMTGVTLTYTGADGVFDNTTLGDIDSSAARELSRDYLYTDNQTVPLTATVGGLSKFVGHKVTLLVYAVGAYTRALAGESTTSELATITFGAANNYLSTAPQATTIYESGTSDAPGRRLEYNNPEYSGGLSSAYVTFTGVVAPGGTVAWSLGPDADAGRIPLVGFQLLVSAEEIAPPVPTNLTATAVTGAINLAWSASSGATTYTVRRATAAAGPYTTLSAGVLNTTSYSDTTVVAGTTYYYVVAAANALATSADSNVASATALSALSALQTWRQSYFGSSANSGSAANTADPDGDGIANLLEYALGTSPTAANGLPVTQGLDSSGRVTLTFTPVVDSTLTYAIQATTELSGTWSVVQTYPGFTTATPVTFVDSLVVGSANPRRFVRLVVTASE